MSKEPYKLPPAPLDGVDRIVRLRDRRERAAKRARTAQALHFRRLKRFIGCSVLAASFGGLVLHGVDAPGAEMPLLQGVVSIGPVKLAISLLELLSVVAASYYGHLLFKGDDRAEWLKYRAEAEEGRLALHRLALELAAELAPADRADGFRAAAAYLRDTLIAGQIRYLSRRIDRMKVSKQWWLRAGACAAAAGTLGAGLAVMQAQPDLVALGALLGVLTPAAIWGVKSWTEAILAGERAELHEETLKALEEAEQKLEGLDAAGEAQDLAAALAWAEPVFASLSRDHQRFLALMREARLPEGKPG